MVEGGGFPVVSLSLIFRRSKLDIPFTLMVGLLQVRILVAARRGKNVWSIGKPPAPYSVHYVPQHIDELWLVKTLKTKKERKKRNSLVLLVSRN